MRVDPAGLPASRRGIAPQAWLQEDSRKAQLRAAMAKVAKIPSTMLRGLHLTAATRAATGCDTPPTGDQPWPCHPSDPVGIQRERARVRSPQGVVVPG